MTRLWNLWPSCAALWRAGCCINEALLWLAIGKQVYGTRLTLYRGRGRVADASRATLQVWRAGLCYILSSHCDRIKNSSSGRAFPFYRWCGFNCGSWTLSLRSTHPPPRDTSWPLRPGKSSFRWNGPFTINANQCSKRNKKHNLGKNSQEVVEENGQNLTVILNWASSYSEPSIPLGWHEIVYRQYRFHFITVKLSQPALGM